MATNLDTLERRLTALEQTVASLRQHIQGRSDGAQVKESEQQAVSDAIAKAYAEMGIAGQAIDAEKLQRMLLACGIKPEENAFSRGIIEMREE